MNNKEKDGGTKEKTLWLETLLTELEPLVKDETIVINDGFYRNPRSEFECHRVVCNVQNRPGTVPGLRVVTINSNKECLDNIVVTITFAMSIRDPSSKVEYSQNPIMNDGVRRRTFEKMAQDIRSFLVLAKKPDDLFFRPQLSRVET